MGADIHIEVMHSGNYHGATDVAHVYNVDTGPLALPEHIKIGAKGTPVGGGHDCTIKNYADQVSEYAIWLEDSIKAGNQEVMMALDEIYNKALGAGVILITACCPAPWITHAHQLKKCIMDLASG